MYATAVLSPSYFSDDPSGLTLMTVGTEVTAKFLAKVALSGLSKLMLIGLIIMNMESDTNLSHSACDETQYGHAGL
jgi:hypothetical protein